VYAVDSFFWLSGFLVVFLLVKQLKKMDARARDGSPLSMGRKCAFWFMFYFHRYYRLTPVYFLIILIWWRLVPQLSDGPVWYRVDSVQQTCNQYWWTNILYINNLHPPNELGECMAWSWYLANDFQFYLITPIIAVLWTRNKMAGTLLALILLVGSYISTILMSYHDLKNQSTDFFTGQPYNTYVKPWVRIPPYLYGLLSAFFLHWVAPNGVEEFRTSNFEPHSASDKVQRILSNGLFRRLIYLVAAVLMFSGMFIDFYQIRQHNRQITWSVGALTVQCTYMRICWGIGLSLIFVPWVLGWGGMANRFLSHDFWTAGARLTYVAYLVHPLLMTVYYGSRYNAIEYSRQWLLFMFFGFLMTSYGVAMVFYLLVEKPMMNLEKYLLPQGH
jgi:peptidoglycan/LPS O-acetylase OafA/YrhL